MNTPKKIMLFSLLVLAASVLSPPAQLLAQPGSSVSLEVFYDQLAPYGRWVDYRDYGRVWIPRVEADFQPYGTRGRWVVTEYGNTWVSDYDWGWAPFHYGRWLFDDAYGWIWVPGNDWGPAWVSWRSGGGYYGWAPLAPRMDVSIHIDIPLLRWIFVPERYVCSPSVYSYCVPRPRVVNVYHSTTIINNIYVNNNRRYFYGPRPQELERATRRRVQVQHLDFHDRPGRMIVSNGTVRAYRPGIREGRTEDHRFDGYNAPSQRPRPDWNGRPQRDGGPEYRYRDRDDQAGRDVRNERWRNQDKQNGQSWGAPPENTGSPRGQERPSYSPAERPSRPSRSGQSPSLPQGQEPSSSEPAPQRNGMEGRGDRWSRPQRSEPERQERAQPQRGDRSTQPGEGYRIRPARGARSFAG
ncbi:DUF6600 domain-containing protein [Arcticibacter sp. MXS-1]|uniref:DUF6600 domain-containing protein n=1 Tax=Arcticibacter sp. MXS-1 TaxID=3341726 RepID=UPI0035A8A006